MPADSTPPPSAEPNAQQRELAALLRQPDVQRLIVHGYLEGQETEQLKLMETVAGEDLLRARELWMFVKNLRKTLADYPATYEARMANAKEEAARQQSALNLGRVPVDS